MTGRPPKGEGERVNRVPLAHGWVDVPDVLFLGAPDIGDRPGEESWPAATRRWWSAVASMPHCVLWRAPDWEYLRVTALVHADVVEGATTRAQELRVRESAIGSTFDALKALRIRYVTPAADGPAVVVEHDEVDARREARREKILAGEVG